MYGQLHNTLLANGPKIHTTTFNKSVHLGFSVMALSCRTCDCNNTENVLVKHAAVHFLYIHHISHLQPSVYSLDVVGAVLGVLNLLPAVGQLWGGKRGGCTDEEKKGKSLQILLRHYMDNWTHEMRCSALTGSFTACLPTPSGETGGLLLFVTMCLGLNTHSGGGRERERKCYLPEK